MRRHIGRGGRSFRGGRTTAGHTIFEYVALGVVAVLIVGGLAHAAVGDDIATGVRQVICRIVSVSTGDCGTDGAGDQSPTPSATPTDGATDKPVSEPSPKPDDSGNALPNLCFDPQERASNSNVSVPGNGPVSTAAAWGYSQLVNFIIDRIDNEKNKEKRVKQALDDMAYCLPDYNIVIAQPHEGNLEQMDGAAMISTVNISGSTYRVYAFKTGTFTWADDADLGWKNRAFRGTFDVSDDRRTVTFSEPSHPKRKKGWKPGDAGCELEGKDLPDRNRYYDTYSPLDNEGSAASVRMLVNDLRRCFPDYNVVAMTSEQASHWVDKPKTMVYHGRYRLNSNEFTEDEKGDDIASGRAVFDVYVFDKGTFSNDGDGGDINWAFYGNFQRNGQQVTFQQPDPADLNADPTPTGSAPVNFNDETPKYTGGGPYPGTDYSGDVPDGADLTHSLIDEYGRTFPGKNIIAVKSFNDMTFSGVSGLEHLAVVNGVDIFAIDKGTVTNKGDGGWTNWAFTGHYERDADNPKVVTFT
jgi:hypothetical protein